jgi:hypothetical protein
LVHRSWSNETGTEYQDECLEIALSALGQNSERTLATLFELEEFASYCTLRSKLEVAQGLLYGSKWVDIAYRKIGQIRASEKCVPLRLLRELEKISIGQTAPLLVNEFNCVADGNHRLAASWIWNGLNSVKSESWNLDNARFEKQLLSYFNENLSPITKLAVSNALEGLSSLLTERESKQRLINLRKFVVSHVVETLPVVPILSYSGLALDRRVYESAGRLCRFNPGHYQILQDNFATCLPEKACYHLADRIPLPLVSVITMEDR